MTPEQERRNERAQALGFRNDYELRQARKDVESAKRSERYREDRPRITERNQERIEQGKKPYTQKEIDAVLLGLAKESKEKKGGKHRDKSMGSPLQLWMDMTGEVPEEDWEPY